METLPIISLKSSNVKNEKFKADLTIKNDSSNIYKNYKISCELKPNSKIKKCDHFDIKNNGNQIILIPNSKKSIKASDTISSKISGTGDLPINFIFIDETPQPTPIPDPTPKPIEGKTPGQIFNILNHFKLETLDPKTLKIIKIEPPNLLNYTSEFFYTDSKEGSMVFRCPDHGETTTNSSDPRIELRDRNEFLYTETHTQTAKLKILDGSSKNHMIFAQLKGGKDGQELCLVHWKDNKIYARIKPFVSPGPDDAVNFDITEAKIGEFITYTMTMSNKTLKLTINGKTVTSTFNETYDKQPLYFKAGCYLKNNTNSGSFGKVAYFDLQQS